MRRIALALSTSIAIVAPENGSMGAERTLTGVEIKSMFTNARVYYRIQQWDGITDYKSDGAMSGTLGDQSDTGRWWVEGDKYCRQWKRWNDGKKRCATVVINGDRSIFRFDNGQVFTGSVPKK